ncbi:galactokinase [Rothia sp. AR01]|uniref:Galactokinase n=1 Tax=Rothia santali TaxID=2949643 RepID=A0A9X2KHP6_9MICC|nr:galactokinase family protein [Rothia santali]MCP3425393.1 galactokinase [Rothia santali]
MAWRPAPPAGEQAERAAGAFRAAYGREPWGIFSAPGRVNLLGEHIDYSGGTVLPLALPHRTVVAVAPREDGLVRAVSAQEDGGIRAVPLDDVAPGAVEGWLAYVAGVPWAMAREGLGEYPGADLAVDSAVPLGAGLSSSAALECAVALAFDALAAEGAAAGASDGASDPDPDPAPAARRSDRSPWSATDAGRARLAAACILAENEIAGASTGGMDQSISLRAREGSVLAIDCRDFSSAPVDVDLDAAGLALLVIDTRAPHRLVDGQYARRRKGCDDAARALGLGTLRDALGEHPDAGAADRALERWDALDPASAAPKAEVPNGKGPKREDPNGDGPDGEGLDGNGPDREGRDGDGPDRKRPESRDGAPPVRALLRHAWTEMARVQRCADLFREFREPEARPGPWAELGGLLAASHASLRDDYAVSCAELDLAVDAAHRAGALGARMTGGGFGGSAIALVGRDDAEPVARAVARAFAREGFAPPEFMLASPSAAARRER